VGRQIPRLRLHRPEAPVDVDTSEDNEGIALVSARLLEALSLTGIGGQSGLAGAVERLALSGPDGVRGIRIAPRPLRERFAFGAIPPSGQPFGFQGLYNMWMFFQPADLSAFLGMATPEILASRAALSLAVNLRDLGRHDESRTVFAAILRVHPGDPLARSLAASASSQQPSPHAGGATPRANVGRNDPCPAGAGASTSSAMAAWTQMPQMRQRRDCRRPRHIRRRPRRNPDLPPPADSSCSPSARSRRSSATTSPAPSRCIGGSSSGATTMQSPLNISA
jgi:hypothetical protein